MPIVNSVSGKKLAEKEMIRENGTNLRKYSSVFEDANDIWLYDTYTGYCLVDSEVNGYDDSDFNMLVWDEKINRPRSIQFASTRYWSYPSYSSRVDATPEIIEKFKRWRIVKTFKCLLIEDRIKANTPRKNIPVEVIKGRKVPIGTVGTIGVIEKPFYFSYYNFKTPVIFDDINGNRYYSYLENFKVINPKQYYTSKRELLNRAKNEII